MMSVYRSIRYEVACTYTCINERGKTTLRWLWNAVDRHSTAEMSDNCESSFALRVRSNFRGLISPLSEPPGEIMSVGVSPVSYNFRFRYIDNRTLN